MPDMRPVDAVRIRPDRRPPRKNCSLCGHEMTFERCGVASVWENGYRYDLCHTEDHDCYKNWTVYDHRPFGHPYLVPDRGRTARD